MWFLLYERVSSYSAVLFASIHGIAASRGASFSISVLFCPALLRSHLSSFLPFYIVPSHNIPNLRSSPPPQIFRTLFCMCGCVLAKVDGILNSFLGVWCLMSGRMHGRRMFLARKSSDTIIVRAFLFFFCPGGIFSWFWLVLGAGVKLLAFWLFDRWFCK